MSDPQGIKDLGEDDFRTLYQNRIDPYAAMLIAESFGIRSPVEVWLESVTFVVPIENGRKVRITLKDETPR